MYILEGIENHQVLIFLFAQTKLCKTYSKKVVLCYKTRIINCDEKKY